MTYEVLQTGEFARWLQHLRDMRAQTLIDIRIKRVAIGNPGDVKSLRGRLCELRVDYGPGYRIYFTQVGPQILLLLVGGDKRTQGRDIENARILAEAWRRERGA